MCRSLRQDRSGDVYGKSGEGILHIPFPSLTASELVSVVMIHTELCCILFFSDLYFIILFNLYCTFFLLPFSPLILPTSLQCVLALAGG